MVLKNENRKRVVIVNQKVEDEPKLLFRARIPGHGGMPARGPLKRCGCMDAFHHWQSGMQPACRNTWSYWDQSWGYYHHKVAPRPRRRGCSRSCINYVGPGILQVHQHTTTNKNKQWQWPQIQTLSWLLLLRLPWELMRVPGVAQLGLRHPHRAPYSVQRKGMN